MDGDDDGGGYYNDDDDGYDDDYGHDDNDGGDDVDKEKKNTDAGDSNDNVIHLYLTISDREIQCLCLPSLTCISIYKQPSKK